MNILITGNLSYLVVPLVRAFVLEKNRVVLASYNAGDLNLKQNNVLIHSINPSESIFRDALSSYNFDVIIYLSTREEQLDGGEGDYSVGQQLDGLRNTLDLCKNGKVRRFFYISSTEVYGNMTDISEEVFPQPASINGYTLSTGERYCRNYQDEYDINLIILRLTNVYGPDEKSGLLYKLIKDGNNKKEIAFPDSPETNCSLIHADDVVDLIKRAIDDDYTSKSLVLNLSSAKPLKYSEIADLFSKYHFKVNYKINDKKNVYTTPVSSVTAKNLYDWMDTHDLATELANFVEVPGEEPPRPKTTLQTLGGQLSRFQNVLKWVELILGAALAQYLSQLTGTLIQFKYVDFRLLFVVIMGSVYGLRFGLYASILISLSVLYTWFQLGFDWSLLVYNVGNWFPFAMYFAAGLITGYTHDKSENAIFYEKKQTGLIYEKYAFLYGVFNEIRALKDEFRERLIGYRDSFGRIFAITSELDQLQEYVVYYKALNILEDIMDNKNIAIYSMEGQQGYARLEVNSTELNDGIAKSLTFSDYPIAFESIKQGKIFQNTSLIPNYPAYVAPVMTNSGQSSVPVAVIVIWFVKFEQYSTYYYNLFKVICGLIQASLVRAALFLNANYEKIYVPSTRILKAEAFTETLKVRHEMKDNKVLDYQLVMLEPSENGIQERYSRISQGIRTTDLVGMDRNGSYYILLSQSNKKVSQEVVDRLEKLGIKGKLIESNEIP